MRMNSKLKRNHVVLWLLFKLMRTISFLGRINSSWPRFNFNSCKKVLLSVDKGTTRFFEDLVGPKPSLLLQDLVTWIKFETRSTSDHFKA